jgi:hypothetical protein
MQLNIMPELLSTLLNENLPPVIDFCKREERLLILTTDHGLSHKNRRLSHGKGGVFEEAVIRVHWNFKGR